MEKLLYSLGLVLAGLGLGIVVQVLERRGLIRLPMAIGDLRKLLQKIALLFFNPVAILGATWIANIDNIRIAALPLIGITALLTGGAAAAAGSRFFRLTRKQTGSYLVSGAFTNIGSLGALFCFIFLGEIGFALVPFYKLFEEFFYYAIGFPVARSFSRDVSESQPFFQRVRQVVSDVFVIVAVSSIAIGLVLNLSGIQRPGFYTSVNAVFIPVAAILLLSSIGMAMRFSSVRVYLKQSLFIAAIKFAIVPAVVVSLGYLAGLHLIDGGLPLKVVLILSSMPVGFIAMVPPTIYDLDIDLANACWLTTNGLLLIEVPLLMTLISIL